MSAQANGADPLIRANKLDLLERVADDLAHEIKNPLHSMVINLEVLKRRIARTEPTGSADMLRYADVLGSELERVSHRIDLLLRMVRPGRGVSTPLHESLDEIRELVEVEGSRRSIQVRFGANNLGARATAPREPARQVILNMVLAVLDTLSEGDALEIETERDAEEVRIRVAGIPAADSTPPAPVHESDGRAMLRDGSVRSIVELLGDELGGRVEVAHPEGALALTFSFPLSR